MLIDPDDLTQLTTQAIMARQVEQIRLRRISNYVRGKQDPPYIPKGVNAEYRWIARKARRNFLPLVISVISQNLHVDGFKPSGTTNSDVSANQPAPAEWEAFRANRMISRQHGVHRSVIKHGTSYVVVLPGTLSTAEEQPADVPVIRPVSPRRMTAFYADDVDDEWPQFAIEVKTIELPQNSSQVFVTVYDEDMRYILQGTPGAGGVEQLNLQIADADNPLLNNQAPVASHGLGVCPVVRFLYEVDLDGEDDCSGEIEPIMPIQDQINFDTFNLMISTQFAAFRQRWVTGMSPVDQDGREATPFRPGIDRVWAAEDPGTHFGEFGETALAPYSSVREDGIRHMATVTQVPPYHLLGQVANMSADALAAARDGLDRKIQELQAGMTDPWRNVFRLTALAGGNKDDWNDLFGRVIWRDTSARAFGATIDGLGKANSMLGVPATELWPRIPGVTAEDVAAWTLAKQREEATQIVQQTVSAAQAGLTDAMAAQQAGLPVAPLVYTPPGEEPPAPPAPPAPTATTAPEGQAPETPPGEKPPSPPGGTPANPKKGPGGRPVEPGGA
jgi:hypothetical protein